MSFDFYLLPFNLKSGHSLLLELRWKSPVTGLTVTVKDGGWSSGQPCVLVSKRRNPGMRQAERGVYPNSTVKAKRTEHRSEPQPTEGKTELQLEFSQVNCLLKTHTWSLEQYNTIQYL